MDTPKTPVTETSTDTVTPDNDVTITLENGATLTHNDDATQLSNITPADHDQTQVLTPKQGTVYSQVSDFTAETQGLQPIRIGVGTVINQRFTLQTLLGRGGMGDVYLATDKRKLEAQDSNPNIAIKLLGDNFKQHPQAFIALQREARKTQQLAHPNIVTVYDFDRQADIVYLTMEVLTGNPLDHIIATFADNHDIKTIIDVINQCAQGLAYAHQKELIHSDLKPGNIFITEENHVKLLDFGIARAFNSGKSLDKTSEYSSQDTIFDAGELGALTPAYASLEMLNGETPTPSDDIYALGIIAYQLLTGKHPFDGTKADTAEKDGLAPERTPEFKKLNDQQWNAIEKALSFKHEDRFNNAQEFYDLFNAKSRLPLIAAATATALAFILVASLNLWFAPEAGPDIAFKDLPQKTQDAVLEQLKHAEINLKYGELNPVISHLNKAYNLHPKNKQVMAALDKFIQAFLLDSNKKNDTDREKDILNLLKYSSLENNRQLKAQLNKQ